MCGSSRSPVRSRTTRGPISALYGTTTLRTMDSITPLLEGWRYVYLKNDCMDNVNNTTVTYHFSPAVRERQEGRSVPLPVATSSLRCFRPLSGAMDVGRVTGPVLTESNMDRRRRHLASSIDRGMPQELGRHRVQGLYALHCYL